MRRILIAALSLLFTHSAWAQSSCPGKLTGVFTPDQARKLCSAYQENVTLSDDPALISSDTQDTDDLKRVRLCGGGAYDASGARGSCIEVQGDDYTGDLRFVTGSGAGASAYLRLNDPASVFRIQDENGTGMWEFQEDGDLAHAGSGGDIILSQTGKTLAIDSSTAGSRCKGTGTFNGTTAVTISTTCAATSMHVSITPTSDPTGTTAAYCWVTNIQNGTSFDVDCDQANDGTFSWVIIKEG